MYILLEVILSILGTLAGLFGINYFLSKRKEESKISKDIEVAQKLKIIYVVAIGITVICFIGVFQSWYGDATLMHQVKLLILILILFPTALVDYKVKLIPNVFILGAFVIRCFIYIFEFLVSPSQAWITLKDNLVAVAIIAGFFLILLIVFKNSIGMGDVKLFAVMGLYQGTWGAFNAVFYSLIVSFFFSIILLILKKVTRKDSVSFAPSILLGTIISIILTGC